MKQLKTFPLQFQTDLGVDESAIYDFDLINKVKTALKEWRSRMERKI